jgi:hypothetical protein
MQGREVEPALSSYSKRPKYFALALIRALLDGGSVSEIGADAALLVIAVVSREDTLRYERAPNFFNGQLMSDCGWRKPDQLIRARNKAVAAGWLHYEPAPAGSRSPGKYWTKIPTVSTPAFGSRENNDRSRIWESSLPEMRNGAGNGSGIGPGKPPVLSLPLTSETAPALAAGEDRAEDCAPPERQPIGPEELQLRWNRIDGVTPCREMTPNRVKAFHARCSQARWRDSMDEALERVAGSEFCRGGGTGGWRASIDWFLKPESLNRLLEGNYDDRRSQPSNGRSHGLYTH